MNIAAIERAGIEAQQADEDFVSFLNAHRYTTLTPEQQGEQDRLMRVAESAYNDYAELKYDVQ